MLKKGLALVLCLCMLLSLSCAFAEETEGEGNRGNEELLGTFILRHGDRSSNMVAITVDDCYKSATEWIERDVELCKEYGIAMTFFPLVNTGCLEEQYRDLWQSVLDAGCEIGTHTNYHYKLGNRDTWSIIGGLGKFQEALDKTLGYHYEVRWLRPPGGTIDGGKKSTKQQVVNALKTYGFDHIIHWDVSETIDLEKALKKIQNGSIMLFHAKKKDTHFLEKLIPELQARGFRMVTVSEMFGFDPPETGEELYVYNKENYRKKE